MKPDVTPSSLTPLVLCSTHRLAHSLRVAHGREQRATGHAAWPALQALTLQQWLDQLLEHAQLCGLIPLAQIPNGVLDPMRERILWEQAIAAALQHEQLGQLFDQAGMAVAAMEANSLMLEWHIVLPDGLQTEETRQFLAWRKHFRLACKQSGWLEPTRYFDWQIAHLPVVQDRIPAEIHLAGFDRFSPQQQRLLDALIACGATIKTWQTGLDSVAAVAQTGCDDAAAECRAAAAWAAQRLLINPQARLAIVVPELGKLRTRLMAILDDTLHPETLHPALAEQPRCYDFSLGEPLAQHPLVSSALRLLGLAVQPYHVAQHEFSALLRDVHFSAASDEADMRARLDARLRRRLAATTSLAQVLRLARKEQLDSWTLGELIGHLQAALNEAQQWPKKQLAARWAIHFDRLLELAGWPGDRSLSSHEYQARQAWREALAEFGRLDDLLGSISAGEALSRLSAICRERVFQPEVRGEPKILVMGMLEAAGVPLDAVWVMGMNDHQWPPPPRPNPLLPAQLQRAVQAPNADSRVQTAFAAAIHTRLLHSAREATFSWAHREGERELRMSPLLAGIPSMMELSAKAATLSEQLAQPSGMQLIDDHQAPTVVDGEHINGGTGLLKAQAICPAWAFYQYRLGARALQEPVEGLDAMTRGSLLHAVLQAFWQGRDSACLQALGTEALSAAISAAVEDGVRRFIETQGQVMPVNFLLLEKHRLHRLLEAWLIFERSRPAFTVKACEQEVSLEIAGMQVRMTLDRIDELAQGELIVIDYKTGSTVDYKSWAEDRIDEPQLPAYAALVLNGEQIAAVCFAKVRADEQGFTGVARDDEVMPGVKGLDSVRRLFPQERFPSWSALLQHWQRSILAIAEEIRSGNAAVCFEDEQALAYCEVRPLLRLPERALQLEMENTGAGDV